MPELWGRFFKGRLAKNSFILFFSEGSSAILTMVTGFLIARLFRVADFGKFTSALAFASILGVLVDSGMGMLAAKDIARGGSAERAQLNQLFTWRLWVILVACLLSPALAWIALPAGEVRRIAFWLTPGVLLLTTTDFYCWIFKGAQRALWCGALQVSSRALLLLLCIAALLSPHPMKGLVLAWLVTGAAMTGLGIFVLAHSMHALRFVSLRRSFFEGTLPKVYKLGTILILSVIFSRVDVMMVARFLGNAQAGLFGAAGRIVDALRLIPMVIYSVYLPVFSTYHDRPALLRAHFKVANDFLLVLSVTIALVGCVFALPLFVHILGAQYSGAVACFRPLVWSCVLMFSNILMFSLLYALNNHRKAVIGISGALVIEILLNSFFLRNGGAVVASWARLLAEAFNCTVLGWGLIHTGVLSSFTFFLRPLLLIGVSATLFLLLRGQPMAVQFALSWGGSMGLALALGFGRPERAIAP